MEGNPLHGQERTPQILPSPSSFEGAAGRGAAGTGSGIPKNKCGIWASFGHQLGSEGHEHHCTAYSIEDFTLGILNTLIGNNVAVQRFLFVYLFLPHLSTPKRIPKVALPHNIYDSHRIEGLRYFFIAEAKEMAGGRDGGKELRFLQQYSWLLLYIS